MGGGLRQGRRGRRVVVDIKGKRKTRRREVRTSADGFRVDYVILNFIFLTLLLCFENYLPPPPL